jgi:hypothetical protein
MSELIARLHETSMTKITIDVAVLQQVLQAQEALIEKWYATRESGAVPIQVVAATAAAKVLKAAIEQAGEDHCPDAGETMDQEPIGYVWRGDIEAQRKDKRLWSCVSLWKTGGENMVAIYTKPQPTPLTDDQIKSIWSESHNDKTNRFGYLVLARMIESAHGIGHA